MIVQNKQATLEKANDISSKLMTLMSDELKSFTPSDDPAEQIYLACHTIGNLLAKIYISLDGYAKIYNIAGLNKDTIKDWVCLICDENLKINKYY